MKVAFLCSSLAAGLDGVGDYTRRLSGELIRQGHPIIAIGLNEPSVDRAMFGSQEIEGTPIPVARFASVTSWRKRITEACRLLDDFNPDWISLQFVPFGFHPKGLCFGLGKRLAVMKPKTAWHIMFHELWLGLDEKANVRHQVWGALQRLIVMDVLRRLRPRVVNTQTQCYRMALSRRGIKASILPLFSNIPRIQGEGWADLLQPLVTEAAGRHLQRNELYLAGVFGRVPPEWDPQFTIKTLFPLIQKSRKRLVLVFCGKNHFGSETFARLKLTSREQALVVIAGERSSDEISRILQTLDLGIATTPRQVIEKSGSTAAMLEHGLKLLVTRNDWRLRGSESLVEEESAQLLFPNEFGLLKDLPLRDSQCEKEAGVRRVARQMLNELTTARAVGADISLKNLTCVKALEA